MVIAVICSHLIINFHIKISRFIIMTGWPCGLQPRGFVTSNTKLLVVAFLYDDDNKIIR